MLWRSRKSLAKALEPSSCAAIARGPKMRRPARAEVVDHARDQRHFRADHGQRRSFSSLGQFQQSIDIGRRRHRHCARAARARCRHCRARRALRSRAAIARVSRPARVRARRSRSPELSWMRRSLLRGAQFNRAAFPAIAARGNLPVSLRGNASTSFSGRGRNTGSIARRSASRIVVLSPARRHRQRGDAVHAAAVAVHRAGTPRRRARPGSPAGGA